MKEDDLQQWLKYWPAEVPPVGLLDRVVRRAVATPQRQGWRDYMVWLGEQVFGYRQSILAYRFAALLICVMAGIAAGNFQHHDRSTAFEIQNLTTADDILGITTSREEQ